MAVYGVIGLVIAVVAAGVIAIVASTAGGAWGALVTAGWVADGVLAAVAVLNLLVTLAAWGRHRRRCADLDAAGAEVVGELHTRIASLRPGDPDWFAPTTTVPNAGRRRIPQPVSVINFCCPPNSPTGVVVGRDRRRCWAWRPTNTQADRAAVGHLVDANTASRARGPPAP